MSWLTWNFLNSWTQKRSHTNRGDVDSRTLSPLSFDPNDRCPLSPAHLLFGRTLVAAPDQLLTDININQSPHLISVSQNMSALVDTMGEGVHFQTATALAEIQSKSTWRKNHGHHQGWSHYAFGLEAWSSCWSLQKIQWDSLCSSKNLWWSCDVREFFTAFIWYLWKLYN